jgi:AcrR family transcriptional regulator
MNRAGRPKGDKRARTRAALIRAASEIVSEKGFEATSLEAVALRAGMTRGAIYGNFKNREELFLAVAESHWTPITPAFPRGMSYPDRMRALGEALIAAMPARRAAAVGAASFTLHALQHEALRRRLVSANAEAYGATEKAIEETGAADDLPMPPADFVRVTHAIIEGLLLLAGLTPELITADVVRTCFDALARLERQPETTPG